MCLPRSQSDSICPDNRYLVSLSGVSATAVAYSDALARLGSMAKMCRGGTEEIGKFRSSVFPSFNDHLKQWCLFPPLLGYILSISMAFYILKITPK